MGKHRLLVAAATTMAAVVTMTTGAAESRVTARAASTDQKPAVRTADAKLRRPSAAPKIVWGQCRKRSLRVARARCGSVAVPLDYANPSGGTVRLAVARVRHTTRRSQGVMLVNPGGPGAPGLEWADLGGLMPKRSGAGYDWVGFDPRGVGASRPRLSCQPNYFHGDRPPYRPTSQALLRTWLRRSEAYAASCAKYGGLLDHMKTVDTARDMDRIRQALGADRISFYGYSYGTYLGQVYATLFPARVRRMVFDSNVDPTQDWGTSGTTQTLALQRVFDLYFAWVARHHETYRLGRSAAAVERLYLRQQRVLRRHPGAGVLGPSEWADTFGLAGYVQVLWPPLTQAFAAWVHNHNPRPLIRAWRLVDTPGDDNGYAAFLATLCTDQSPPTDWREEIESSRRLYRQAPITTWPSTWFSAPCLFWPAEPGAPVSVDGHDVSVLLLGQTLDGATPFEGSLTVRDLFPGSRLVAIRGGTTHSSTPDLAGPCARARLAAYLATGALPPRLPGRRADVSCPAPRPPSP